LAFCIIYWIAKLSKLIDKAFTGFENL